jgi:starch phosphorylase
MLEEQVVPAYYGRGDDGLPHEWIAKVRSALKTVGPGFSAGRMIDDYVQRMYAGAPSPAETH